MMRLAHRACLANAAAHQPPKLGMLPDNEFRTKADAYKGEENATGGSQKATAAAARQQLGLRLLPTLPVGPFKVHQGPGLPLPDALSHTG